MDSTCRKIFAFLTLVILMIGILPQGRAAAQGRQSAQTFALATSLTYGEARPLTTEEQEVWDKSMAALNSLGEFWSAVFAQYNRSFRQPATQPDGRTLAHYDPNTNTIHFNLQFLILERRKAAANLGTDGDMAYIIVLAHEYGHAVQAHLGLLGRSNRELQADLLAGIWAQYAHEQGLLDPGDPEEASNALLRAGGGDHGTGSQRVAAFNRGYSGGAGLAFKE